MTTSKSTARALLLLSLGLPLIGACESSAQRERIAELEAQVESLRQGVEELRAQVDQVHSEAESLRGEIDDFALNDRRPTAQDLYDVDLAAQSLESALAALEWSVVEMEGEL